MQPFWRIRQTNQSQKPQLDQNESLRYQNNLWTKYWVHMKQEMFFWFGDEIVIYCIVLCLYAESSFIYEKPHRKECLCEKVLKWCFFCKTVNTGWLSHARGLEPKYLVCSHFKKHFLCEQLCESTSANVYQPATSMALVCIIKVHS